MLVPVAQQFSKRSTCSLRTLDPPNSTCSPWYSSPSSDSVRRCDGIRELSFCLDCIVQVKLVLDERQPELFHGKFSRELGPRAQICIWPHSSSLFVKQGSLFLPFRCTDRRISVRFVLRSPALGASARTSSWYCNRKP